jgi:uncharacterized protein (TIGR02285 family)
MFSSVKGTLFFLALLFGAAGAVRAGEKPRVYWPYFDLPPQFIVGRDRPEGMGIDVARELQRELPEYEHVFILASPQRIDEELRNGRERMVASGLLKTPEREAYILYSDVPCRLTFSSMVVVRQEDLWRLAPGGSASLASLAADQRLSFGYIPGISYGPFNRFLAPLLTEAGPRRCFAAHDAGQLLDMLAEKRIDWFVHDNLGIRYVAKERGEIDRIAVVGAWECPPAPVYGYFACPWTDQGLELMARINRAMVRLVASNRLYRSLRGWVPARFGADFDRAYYLHILSAAHMASFGGDCRRGEH